jgi:hypothetical protein
MAYFQKLQPQALQSVAFGSVGASYSTLGTATNDIRLVKIVNYTDQPVFISWNGDGSTNNDFIPEKGFALYDVTSNRVQDDGCFVGNGTVFSVKRAGSAPSLGSVYLVLLYTQVR